MKFEFRTLAVLSVSGLWLAVPAARAQVATGPWTSYSPTYSIQEKGCGDVNGSDFYINCSDSSVEQRAERRYPTYYSGSRQFEGYLTVKSLGGTRISVKQTFEDQIGAFFILAIENGGRLYSVNGNTTVGSFSIGSARRINTIHYTGSDKVVVYVNGSLAYTQYGNADGVRHYDKIGAYRTNSGYGPVHVYWSSVKFWYK